MELKVLKYCDIYCTILEFFRFHGLIIIQCESLEAFNRNTYILRLSEIKIGYFLLFSFIFIIFFILLSLHF